MGQADPDRQPLSAVLRDLADAPDPELSVGEIADRFGGRALGALLLVFSLICVLPLPPGGTTIFGAPLLLLAPQLLFGVGAPWLPARLRRRSVAREHLGKGLMRAVPWLERVEAVSRPRLEWLFGAVGRRVIGLVCTVFAVVLILPVPLGNVLPAASMGVLSLSLVQRDGVLALAGYGLAAASVSVLVLAAGAIARMAHHLLELASFA
jgi:hypothetical protein